MMQRREPGFTVVEIIIAVLLVTVVISGVTLALAGGAKLETKRDIKSRMVAASERVYEHVRADKAWIKNCRRAKATSPAKTCNLTPIIDADLLEDDIFGDKFKFNATASATGVDSDGDGVGAADADGNADDFFKISVSISVPKADLARLGSPLPREVESIVNGSTNVDSGGLVVAFCSADNQIDERVQISGCETGGTYWTEMPACAGEPACTPWALGALKGIPATITSPSRMLGIRPVTGVNFSLKRVADGDAFDGPGTVSSALAVTSASDPELGPGVYKFPDLPVGSWKIVTPAVYPGGRVDWPTHHVPSTKQATVERNRTARALVMLQDPASSSTLSLTFSRKIYERNLDGGVKRFKQNEIPECEAPSSYYSNPFVNTKNTCYPGGHFVAQSELGGKGQQMGESDFYTRYESWGKYQDFVDVYYFAQNRAEDEWPGAADTGTFNVQPAPRGRYTIRSGGATPTYTTPLWTTGAVPEAPNRTSGGSTAWKTVGTNASISGLPAGLHTPLTLAAPSKINNVSTTYSPADCDYLWVRADTNGLGPCSSAHMVGDDGECYTNLSGGPGIPSYSWRTGCESLWWINKYIAKPTRNYLLYKVCGHRQSWVMNAFKITVLEFNFQSSIYLMANPPEYGTPEYDELYAAQRAAYIADYKAQGYDHFGGTHGPSGIGGTNGYFHMRENYGTSTRTHSSPCIDWTNAPLDCPGLDRWDNCDRSETVVITKSSGWNVGGGNEDGHKFQTKGGGIASMSP